MIVIGQFAGHQVAAKHAKARGHHYPLHVVWSKMGHLQHDWLHIAIPAIYAGLPQECGQKNQPGSRAAEKLTAALRGSGLAVMARGRQNRMPKKAAQPKKAAITKAQRQEESWPARWQKARRPDWPLSCRETMMATAEARRPRSTRVAWQKWQPLQNRRRAANPAKKAAGQKD